MKCKYCGNENGDNTLFCTNCGERLATVSQDTFHDGSETSRHPGSDSGPPGNETYAGQGQSDYGNSGNYGRPAGYQQGLPNHAEMYQGQYPGSGGPVPVRSSGQVPGKFNWGAFTMSIFWGIGNECYLSLLTLIPIFGFIWQFVCGFKGNEWAWEKGGFRDMEEFSKIQGTWNKAGFVMVIVWVIALIGILLFSSIIGSLATMFI